MRRRRSARDDLFAVADTVQRLAVLLQSGVAPARAWTHLADMGDASAERVHSAIEGGVSVATAIEAAGPTASARRGRAPAPADPWADVAAAWRVATTVGAPMAETLRGLAAALRDAQQTADDVRVALAEPAGTARLMAWLPLVSVVLGISLGFDTVTVLVGSPVGIACLVAGVLLILAARRWSAALVRRARAATGIPGLDADVLAIALSGGVSIDRAHALVMQATGTSPDPSTAAVLALSRSAGVPAVELLRAAAALARHRARVDGRVRAARLSARLLLPLGVCTLPAFLLLGVAPMLLSVLSAAPLAL